MADRPDDVESFFAEYPAAVRDIAVGLRAAIRAALPQATEMLDRSGRVVGYGFGSGYSELVCTIIPSKTGVKLGIVNGAHLPDPHRLLEGEGKRHRYVPLTAHSDLQKPGLSALLQAAAAARAAGGERRG
jgi:hypothetical protein